MKTDFLIFDHNRKFASQWNWADKSWQLPFEKSNSCEQRSKNHKEDRGKWQTSRWWSKYSNLQMKTTEYSRNNRFLDNKIKRVTLKHAAHKQPKIGHEPNFQKASEKWRQNYKISLIHHWKALKTEISMILSPSLSVRITKNLPNNAAPRTDSSSVKY